MADSRQKVIIKPYSNNIQIYLKKLS